MSGWIKSYRSVLKKSWYKKSEYFHLWHHLLYMANRKSAEGWFKGENKKLNPGEFLTGRDKLSDETGINRNKVERILKTFENEHQIEQQKSSKGRLIRIINWDIYQSKEKGEQQSEQQVSNKRATSEQQMSTNKNIRSKRKKEFSVEYAGKFSDFPEVPKAWSQWIEYRKEIGHPVESKQTVVQNLNCLNTYDSPEEAIAHINKAIAMGWRGLFKKDNYSPKVRKPTVSRDLLSDDDLIDQYKEAFR